MSSSEMSGSEMSTPTFTSGVVLFKHQYDSVIERAAKDGFVLQTSASEANRLANANKFSLKENQIRKRAKKGIFNIEFDFLTESQVIVLLVKGYNVSWHANPSRYCVSWGDQDVKDSLLASKVE
jgi:hypothetical protein